MFTINTLFKNRYLVTLVKMFQVLLFSVKVRLNLTFIVNRFSLTPAAQKGQKYYLKIQGQNGQLILPSCIPHSTAQGQLAQNKVTFALGWLRLDTRAGSSDPESCDWLPTRSSTNEPWCRRTSVI